MWTKRDRTLTNCTEISAYIGSMDNFHDYRLGSVDIEEESIQITIEEDTASHANSNVLIWDMTFTGISNLRLNVDCIIPSFIDEIIIEGNEIKMRLNNGNLFLSARNITLGIPSQHKAEATKNS